MIGHTILHYRILAKLGEGGMGVVYKAEDTRLKRTVALKFLPSDTSAPAEEIARFQQEAEAVSALNHPGIATLFDIGEDDGRKFLALEFLPGGTLKEKLRAMARDGRQFSVNEAADYCLQMAEGLAHAHRHQIVHRDIKTDNVMLTAEGRVKITDFGLAKLRGTNQLTKAGSTVGTLAYMAPEQMRGEDVDARADIFSLGVVFFELLAGRTPFPGEHDAAVMYSVLNEEPLPMAGFRSDVPEHIGRALDRLLKKDRAARYQTMDEFILDLRGAAAPGSGLTGSSKSALTGSPAAGPDSKSIVVLPFGNLSPEKENEYFSDGLTEEIISDLSKVRSLRVISRTSTMLLKGTTKDIRAIARELGVRYVLEGSVRKAGQNVRVTAQLIDGHTDANLWSEKYTGTLDDIFEVQEGVSRAIVAALKVTLTPDEERRLEERPIRDAKAHDLYLRARGELQRGDAGALIRSTELLNEGLAIVGENELLFAALGHTYFARFRWINKADESLLERANEYARKTFAMNPASPDGFVLQGLLLSTGGDIGGAIRSLKQAVALEPTNTEAHFWLAIYYSWAGRGAEALKEADKAISLDPLSPINTMIKGIAYIYNGEFEKGVYWIRRGYDMDPNPPLAKWSLVIGLAWFRKDAEAAAEVEALARIAPGWVYTQHALFLRHAVRGEKELALRYATEELALEAKHDLHFSLHVAHCYAMIGEKAKALDFLEHSVRMGMLNHRFLSQFDRLLENLRNEERFTSLMREAQTASEQLVL
jgi:serine/threonine protein kinase/tetratricopeptide (TPR) repeat protein